MLEIKNGPVCILVNDPKHNGSFEFSGLMLNSKPDVVYKDHIWGSEPEIPGKTSVSMSVLIYDKLKAMADAELKSFIDSNIERKDFYTQKSEYGRYTFFEESRYSDVIPKEQFSLGITYSRITEGVIEGTINHVQFAYDLIQGEFTEIKNCYGDRDTLAPIDVFYSQPERLERLAIEQYLKGIAHPVFTEMVNLNKFLQGKKSVKLVLKNGSTHELKYDHINAKNIVNIVGSQFFIEDSYWLKPRLQEGYLPIKDLDYLQFAKKVYRINPDNLVIE